MCIPVFVDNFTTADMTSGLSGHSLDLPMYHPLKTIISESNAFFQSLILSRNKMKLREQKITNK